MTPDSNNPEESVRRIKRGCFGSALIFAAMAVLLTSATGNLFFLTLILISLALVALSRVIR